MMHLIVACTGWVGVGLVMGVKWGFWEYANLFFAISNTARIAYLLRRKKAG